MAACQHSADIVYNRHASHDSGHHSIGKKDSFQLDDVGTAAVEEAGVGSIPETPPLARSLSEPTKNGKHINFTAREDSGLGNEDFYSLTGSPHHPEQPGDIGAADIIGLDKEENVIDTHNSATGCSESSDSSCAVDSSREEVDFAETPETLAVRKCYPQLSGEISLQLMEMSTELYARSLIDQPILNQVLEVNSDTAHVKALKVLNAVGTRLNLTYNDSLTMVTTSPTPSKQFEDFVKVLEKLGLDGIARRVRDSYAESVIEAKNNRPPLTGNSDKKFKQSRRSSVLTQYRNPPSKSVQDSFKRGTSHPAYTPSSYRRSKWRENQSHSADADVSTDEEEEGTTDPKMRWKQVIQSNAEAIKFKLTIKKLKKKIKKQKETITQLRNDNEELVVKMNNLEVQNNLLLVRQSSLISTGTITDLETDFPDCPTVTAIWSGCQYCYKKGNVFCKESIV